jgi:hypothetical protein
MAALTRELDEQTGRLDGRTAVITSGIIGTAGAIGVALGIAFEPQRAMAAYLAAWVAVTTVAAGALIILLIGYAANAKWPTALRRVTEAIAAALVPCAVLFVPLVVFAGDAWPWVDHPTHPLWQSTPAFVARACVYLAICVVPAELLRRWSQRRDRAPEPQAQGEQRVLDRERAFASAFLPPVGLALTFAAFDWVMSVQPEWTSSVFGLYVSIGALASGLALVIALAAAGARRGAMPVTGSHFHAAGRLLHAFVIVWAYLAFFQAMLIQIANKPEEVTFFIARLHDGWRFVTVLLVIGMFAVPFPLLLSRRFKFRPRFMAGLAVVVLVAHYLDAYWMIVPAVADAVPSWTDLAAACAVIGLTTCAAVWRARGVPLVPVGDPYLEQALAYESPL